MFNVFVFNIMQTCPGGSCGIQQYCMDIDGSDGDVARIIPKWTSCSELDHWTQVVDLFITRPGKLSHNELERSTIFIG